MRVILAAPPETPRQASAPPARPARRAVARAPIAHVPESAEVLA